VLHSLKAKIDREIFSTGVAGKLLNVTAPVVANSPLDDFIRLDEIGLAKMEVNAWLNGEPDFAKRIVTPLENKRIKHRRDVTQSSKLYIQLSVKVPLQEMEQIG
jgi:hypothetical protein